MSTLMEELTAIKTVEDKLTANKVANFAYTDHAYNNPLTEADGVESYDAEAEQNIPLANASVLNVNSTVLTKGWRAQASSITRMLMNHFLGRCSYNLNKINDLFSTLLAKLMAYVGEPNGLATLDENGHVPTAQLSLSKGDVGLGNVLNTGDSNTPTENGTDKFTTGGAYTMQQAVNGKAPINHASATDEYGQATTSKFGHAILNTPIYCFYRSVNTLQLNLINHVLSFVHIHNSGQADNLTIYSGEGCGISWLLVNGGTTTAGHTDIQSSGQVVTNVPSNADIFLFIERAEGLYVAGLPKNPR